MTFIMKLLIVIQLFLFAGILAPVHNVDNSTDVKFVNANISEAKTIAGAQGKLAFVAFSAKWCSPCKWMDQTTYRDRSVSTYLNDHFVSIKVDIDDFDGFNMKEEYNVSTIPTMIIFNSKGEMVERLEETMAPSKMIEILKQHNQAANTIIVQHQKNTSPFVHIPQQSETRIISKRAIPISLAKGYMILLGEFQEEKVMLRYYKKIKTHLSKNVSIHKKKIGSKMIYKVLVGKFDSMEAAKDICTELEARFMIKGKVFSL